MRTVAITDGGAGAIGFFGFFALVAVLGFGLIVLKALLPATRGSDADRGFAMKIAGVWLLGSAAFVGGYFMVWGELSEIRIGDDGTWSLRNPVGYELGALGGGVERSVRTQWLTPDEIDQHESVAPHQPARLTATTVAGELFEVHVDAGATGVFDRLGYAPGGPCADPSDQQHFPRHTYTKRGPWCPQTGGAASTPSPAAPPAGEPVFSIWSKDGWWYPARAGARDAARGAEVTYSDGSKEWRSPTSEFGPRKLPPVAHLQADWAGKGKYFPCVVEASLGAGRYEVQYADGSAEKVTDERLRFRLPRPDDLVFAESARDGWWYSARVVSASIDGLLLRLSGHAADEKKGWDDVLPLQLPAGTRVEAGGKPAVVVAHVGTQAVVRRPSAGGSPGEEKIAVGELRFKPSTTPKRP